MSRKIALIPVHLPKQNSWRNSIISTATLDSSSTKRLYESCFGIILGLSDSVAFPTYTAHLWEKFTEYLDDEGCIASIGTAGNPITMNENIPHFRDLGEKHFISIRNHVTFLDIQTAEFYIDKMLPLLEDDAFGISEETKVNAYYVAFQATFLGSPHLRFY